MDPMIAVWFLLIVAFLILEANTVSLVSAWFALGALAALIASFCGGEIWLQVLLFLTVSAGLLAALRPIAKKYFTPKIEKTNVDALVGTTGRVIQSIDNDLGTGRVKLGGIEWSARSTSGMPIEEGTMICVDKIAGVKVFVSLAQESANIH